jgi:hypothetical protein
MRVSCLRPHGWFLSDERTNAAFRFIEAMVMAPAPARSFNNATTRTTRHRRGIFVCLRFERLERFWAGAKLSSRASLNRTRNSSTHRANRRCGEGELLNGPQNTKSSRRIVFTDNEAGEIGVHLSTKRASDKRAAQRSKNKGHRDS